MKSTKISQINQSGGKKAVWGHLLTTCLLRFLMPPGDLKMAQRVMLPFGPTYHFWPYYNFPCLSC